MATSTPSLLYRGVRLEPNGRWAAHVSEGQSVGRLIGYFKTEVGAALAHDRVAIVLGCGGINFPPSFNTTELYFLRQRCTEDSVFRAVTDETLGSYNIQYREFLWAEFLAYCHGAGSQETTRAVAEFIARHNPGPEWFYDSPEGAGHTFVRRHLNPVHCPAWRRHFYEGDPNRSFFDCSVAHRKEEREAEAKEIQEAKQELEAKAKEKREASERYREAMAAGAAASSAPRDTAAGRGEQKRPNSSCVKLGCMPLMWSSVKSWLRRQASLVIISSRHTGRSCTCPCKCGACSGDRVVGLFTTDIGNNLVM